MRLIDYNYIELSQVIMKLNIFSYLRILLISIATVFSPSVVVGSGSLGTEYPRSATL